MFTFNIKKDAVSYSLSEIKRMKDEGLVPTETLEALRKKADECLERPLVSVTKKILIPPSANPHDYMSMGTSRKRVRLVSLARQF